MVTPSQRECSICLQSLGDDKQKIIGHGLEKNLHPIHLKCKQDHYLSEGKNDLSCPECRVGTFDVSLLFTPYDYIKMKAKLLFVNITTAVTTTAAMYASVNLIVRTMGAVFVTIQYLSLLISYQYLLNGDYLKLAFSMVVIAPVQLGVLFVTGASCFYSLHGCANLAERVGSHFREYNKQAVAKGVVGACAISITCAVVSASTFTPLIPMLSSAAITGFLAFKDKTRH